jgi:hypothetical protein
MDPVVVSFLTVIGSAVAAYSGAYFKKRGEDQAITDGFAEVLRQTRETTQATKAIEAKISGEMWDRQKQWEMKREVIFDMRRKLSTVDDALLTMHLKHKHYRTLAQSVELVDATSKAEDFAKVSPNWGKAADEYDGALALMSIVCSGEVYEALREFIILTRQLVPEIKKEPHVYFDSSLEIAEQLKRIRELMRKELGVDPT